MTSKRAIIDALIQAGAAPIEPVEPRLGHLEDRLVAAIAAEDDRFAGGIVVGVGGTDIVTDIVARHRVRRARLTLLAVAASIVAVVVLAFTVPDAPDDGLVVAAADGVSIVLPDGAEVDGAAGVELVDGARLAVNGSLRVGDHDYGPGNYVIADDRVVRVIAPSTTSTTSTPVVPTTVDIRTTAPGSTTSSIVRRVPDRPASVSTIVDRPDTTVASTRDVAVRPTVTRPATTVAETRPASTVPVARPTTVAETRPPVTDAPVVRPVPTRPAPSTTDAPTGTAPSMTRPPATDAPARRPATTIGER